MDPQHFDRIARIWATSSRRRFMAGLAATALTGLRPSRAGAACTPETCDETFACGEKVCVTQCESIFEPAGELCRAAANECDVAEVCTGSSLFCPVDRKRPNGAACSGDGNPCTNDVCQNGECVHVPNTAACANDGNACTNDVCQDGTCTHPLKQDGSACPDGSCCGGRVLTPRPTNPIVAAAMWSAPPTRVAAPASASASRVTSATVGSAASAAAVASVAAVAAAANGSRGLRGFPLRRPLDVLDRIARRAK